MREYRDRSELLRPLLLYSLQHFAVLQLPSVYTDCCDMPQLQHSLVQHSCAGKQAWQGRCSQTVFMMAVSSRIGLLHKYVSVVSQL